jgi:hypothetical protein
MIIFKTIKIIQCWTPFNFNLKPWCDPKESVPNAPTSFFWVSLIRSFLNKLTSTLQCLWVLIIIIIVCLKYLLQMSVSFSWFGTKLSFTYSEILGLSITCEISSLALLSYPFPPRTDYHQNYLYLLAFTFCLLSLECKFHERKFLSVHSI